MKSIITITNTNNIDMKKSKKKKKKGRVNKRLKTVLKMISSSLACYINTKQLHN